jgi:hypothetical protein
MTVDLKSWSCPVEYRPLQVEARLDDEDRRGSQPQQRGSVTHPRSITQPPEAWQPPGMLRSAGGQEFKWRNLLAVFRDAAIVSQRVRISRSRDR